MTAIFDRLVPRSLYRTLSSPAPSQAEPTMSKRMSNRLSLNRTSNPSGMSGGGGNGFLGSWAQRGFFGAVLVEFLIIVTFISILVRDELWREHLDNFSRVQYAVLVSMLFLTLDALRQGNIVQVISVSAFNVPILFYSIFQRINAFDAFFNEKLSSGAANVCGGEGLGIVDTDPNCVHAVRSYHSHVGLLTAAPIVIGLTQVALSWLTWVLAKEFGWATFRTLGGDLNLKRMNTWDMRLKTLLLCDTFYFAIYTIYSTIFMIQTINDKQRAITLTMRALIILTIVLQYLILFTPLAAMWALRKEYRAVMYLTLSWIFIGTCVVVPLTFTKVYAKRDAWDWYTQNTVILRIVLATINCLLVAVTTVLGVFVAVRQFGGGLKESREAAQAKAQGQAGMGTPRGERMYFDEERDRWNRGGEEAEMSGLGGKGRVTIE